MFFVRWIFKIVLQSNQNIVLILAGSLASIPVNILTGFYGSSSYTCVEWILHIFQLVTSILFYAFYLRFVCFFLYIREQGETYANGVFTTSSHNSREEIEQAVKNVQYFSCMQKYKSVRASVCMTLGLGIILVVLLLIPPDFFTQFAQFVQSCISNLENAFHSFATNRTVKPPT